MSDTIFHPALFFDPAAGVASVGIVNAKRESQLIIAEHGCPPKRWDTDEAYKLGRVQPKAFSYPGLVDRWAPADLTSFLQAPTAPGFAELLSKVRGLLLEHLEFPRPEWASLVACWIASTYFFPLFPAFPRLNVNGERQSGKSKLLQLIAEIAFNGLMRLNPTPAVLFRLIEALRATLCLDEMEGLSTADRQTILSIINSGYKAGGAVDRTEGEAGSRHVESYQVYAAMALGGIAGLNDTTADRSITVVMHRGQNPKKLNTSVEPHAAIFGLLRAGCYRLALTHFADVRKAWETLEPPPWLVARHRELYSPLLAVAKLAEQDEDLSFLQHLLQLAKDELDDRNGLPEDGWALFYELEKRLRKIEKITVFPNDLVGPLGVALGSKTLTTRAVGALFRRYGFDSGKRIGKGYPYTVTRAHFLDHAKRYGYPVAGFPAVESTGQAVPSGWSTDLAPLCAMESPDLTEANVESGQP